METFSSLLAICARNSPVTGEFHTHASDAELWWGFFLGLFSGFFFLSAPWINGWVNDREAGDLRRHHAHFGVIVILGTVCCLQIYSYYLSSNDKVGIMMTRDPVFSDYVKRLIMKKTYILFISIIASRFISGFIGYGFMYFPIRDIFIHFIIFSLLLGFEVLCIMHRTPCQMLNPDLEERFLTSPGYHHLTDNTLKRKTTNLVTLLSLMVP